MLIRRLARPMLAAIFVSGGINVLRDSQGHAKAAAPLVDRTLGQVRDSLPEQVPTDPETLVRVDGVVKVGAGALLAAGRFPRLSSLALAASMVPTTLVGHSFWEVEDPQQRTEQQIHFLKNAGLIGGLLISSVDTKGKPSVGYRTRSGAEKARKTAKKKARAHKR